ncbi:head-tail connector protein [Bacteroides salyersiae]|jgi:uncharacterized phage protein (predicted DNA packaging)|uniref:head-tail connector protein n=1 Tax=Bacteroides salyersiae TaxID=291644 RepID=UPI00101CDB75|nr:head-tail connector protein [Bacteroides salyersiae]DAE60892.1 MAG TPA: Head Tail Connector Protein [Caudoviricetes sp.]
MYLNLDIVKKHLNIEKEYTLDDEYILNLMCVAENAVEKHIDNKLQNLEDEAGNLPASLLHAIMLLVANFYANRESVAFASSSEIPTSYNYLLDLFKDYSTKTTI